MKAVSAMRASVGNQLCQNGLPIPHVISSKSVAVANQIVYWTIMTLHTETYRKSPDPSFPVRDTERDPSWDWLGLACERTLPPSLSGHINIFDPFLQPALSLSGFVFEGMCSYCTCMCMVDIKQSFVYTKNIKGNKQLAGVYTGLAKYHIYW